MTAIPQVVRTLDEWAGVIRADLTGAVEGLIAAGRHLTEAKADHPGTFVAWVESGAVGVSVRAAQYLMSVGEQFGALDTQTFAYLPPDRTALYELARLDPPQLTAAIEAGEVTPDMGRKQAKALVAAYRTKPPGRPALRVVDPATYPTIVVDPPWQYENTATRGAAEDHYPTMTLDELADLEIPAAVNAHLYLWATNGFLRPAFDLLDAWGFTYKTCLTWCKPSIGMGNYFRNNTEHVLFAVRGRQPTSADNIGTWFRADRRRHSAKPEAFYDLVERSSPGPYYEMFARRRRLGWETWGDEA